MPFRTNLIWVSALAAGALFAGPGSARADEAFLCGKDEIVYVQVSELEHQKKTDPCIAAYFGLTVESAPAAAPAAAATATASVTPAAIKAQGTDGKPIVLKALRSREDRITIQARAVKIEPPVAVPGTDFRNVRVINASSPEDEWFKHTR